MNRKIIDTLFILILVSAPFKLANKIFALPGFIGGPFSRDFVIWPLLIGLLYTLYCQWKYGNVFYEWHKFKKFIIIYIVILFISLTCGFIIYPYWDMFFYGQAINNTKFAIALGFFNNVGISLEENTFLVFWLVLKFVKNIILNLFYTFGGVYMIFCWYYDRMDKALQLLKNVTVAFLIIVAAYGIVDMCYQNGQWWAQNFISVMWPILHTNTETSTFPMFLDARNRSLFLEASYFAIYMAFAFPILWWKMAESDGKLRIGLTVLYLILACELYLGQSRTGTALLLIELFLLTILGIYNKNRAFLSFITCLVTGAILSFGASIYFLQNYQVPAIPGERVPLAERKDKIIQKGLSLSEVNEVGIESYMNESLLSLFDAEGTGKRIGSNHVRLGITKANIDIGSQHPLLGVGPGLDTAYLYEKFKSDQNREINRFIKFIENNGLISSGSPVMCEYSAQFMQTGFLGIFFFVFPMGYILVCFLRRLYRKINNKKEFYAILFIILADIGIFATGFGNTVNITYCYWLMLGISYVVEFALRERKEFMFL